MWCISGKISFYFKEYTSIIIIWYMIWMVFMTSYVHLCNVLSRTWSRNHKLYLHFTVKLFFMFSCGKWTWQTVANPGIIADAVVSTVLYGKLSINSIIFTFGTTWRVNGGNVFLHYIENVICRKGYVTACQKVLQNWSSLYCKQSMP